MRLIRWLTVRVVVRRRAGAGNALVLSLGSIVLVWLALVTLSAPLVADRQSARLHAIAPRLDSGQAVGDSKDLRMVVPTVTDGRRWNGHAITREFYARGDGTLVAPGLRAMPRPGDFYASPALTRLIADDPVIHQLFSHQHLVGTIAPSGLVEPHQLRAIVGVDDREQLLVKVRGFGGSAPSTTPGDEDRSALNRFVGLLAGSTAWLPAFYLLVIVGRLSRRSRIRRSATLRLLGLSRTGVLALHTAEAAAICIPSAIIAAVGFRCWAASVTTVPGTRLGFFAADARLPTIVTVAVALAAVIGTIGVVIFGATEGHPRRGHRGEQDAVRLRTWFHQSGRMLLPVGLCLLALPPLLHSHDALMPLALWAGACLFAVGLATAGPDIAATCLRRLTRRTRSPGKLVGARMVSLAPVSPALRLASALTALVILFLGTQSFAGVLNGGDATTWAARLADQAVVPTRIVDLAGDLTLERVTSATRPQGAAVVTSLRVGSRPFTAVYADCADLDDLTGHRLYGCDADPHWLRTARTDPRTPHGVTRLPSGSTVELPPHDTNLVDPRLPPEFDGALLLPRALAPAIPSRRDGSTYLLLLPNGDLLASLARAASLSPSLQIDLGDLDRHNPDTAFFPEQLRWLDIGAALGLMIGLLALVSSVLGEVRDRAPRFRALRVLGASRRDLVTAHLWSTAAPLALLGCLALFGGWLVAAAMHNVDDRALIHAGVFAQTGAGVLVAAAIVALTTWPSILKASERSGGVAA